MMVMVVPLVMIVAKVVAVHAEVFKTQAKQNVSVQMVKKAVFLTGAHLY